MGRAQRPIRASAASVPWTMPGRVNLAGTAVAQLAWLTFIALLALIFKMRIITTRETERGPRKAPAFALRSVWLSTFVETDSRFRFPHLRNRPPQM